MSRQRAARRQGRLAVHLLRLLEAVGLVLDGGVKLLVPTQYIPMAMQGSECVDIFMHARHCGYREERRARS
eukprot:3427336-Pyramimonas_sp.AAC.1